MVDGLGLITWGVVLWVVGFLLLAEYRRLFFENPRAAMTFEVFAQVVLKAGGPGYFCLCASRLWRYLPNGRGGNLNRCSTTCVWHLLVHTHMPSNNAFERSVGKCGPRLAAAGALRPAAQLGR